MFARRLKHCCSSALVGESSEFRADYAFNFLLKSNTLGVAMKMELYVPTTTPIIKANTKPLMLSPPNKKMVSNTTNVESEVLMVRLRLLQR